MDFRNRIIRRWMAVLGLVLGVALVATACAAPAAPAQPTAVPIPQVTVDVSDTSLTAPAEMPSGIVEVTVKNSGEAPHGPLFARLNEGATLDQFMQAFQRPDRCNRAGAGDAAGRRASGAGRQPSRGL